MMTNPIDPQYIPPADDQAIPAAIPPKQSNTHVPDDEQLAERWKAYNLHVAYGLNEFRKYNNGIWVPIEKTIIENEVIAILKRARSEGVRVTNALINSVTEVIRKTIYVPTPKWNNHTEYLPCKNGVLHIPTKTLLPHAPDIYATSQLDFDYDPAATCPNFMYAINQNAHESADFLQEYAGYCLTPETKYELAIWMQGMPGSGKSTIIEGFKVMLGKQRCGTLGLSDIERSRFGFSQLPGKTLVVSTESPESYIKMSHVLNALISGETIRIEEKYEKAMDINPQVKIIWAMNNLPRVNDANNGLMRRVKVIKFPPLHESLKDINLKDRIKQEGAGILNWALAGLDRLNARGRFEFPQSVQDATKEFQEKNDLPAVFLEDIGARIDLKDPKCRIGSQHLYDQYKDWCHRNGHEELSSTKMANEWERLGFRKVIENGRKFWVGIDIPFSAWNKASNP